MVYFNLATKFSKKIVIFFYCAETAYFFDICSHYNQFFLNMLFMHEICIWAGREKLNWWTRDTSAVTNNRIGAHECLPERKMSQRCKFTQTSSIVQSNTISIIITLLPWSISQKRTRTWYELANKLIST